MEKKNRRGGKVSKTSKLERRISLELTFWWARLLILPLMSNESSGEVALSDSSQWKWLSNGRMLSCSFQVGQHHCWYKLNKKQKMKGRKKDPSTKKKKNENHNKFKSPTPAIFFFFAVTAQLNTPTQLLHKYVISKKNKNKKNKKRRRKEKQNSQHW